MITIHEYNLKFRPAPAVTLILCLLCISAYALDPSLTLEDHIKIREQQRENHEKNQEILEKEKNFQREAVIQEMQQSPFPKQQKTIPRSGKLLNKKRKYIQWIILTFLLAVMLFVHYRTKKHTD